MRRAAIAQLLAATSVIVLAAAGCRARPVPAAPERSYTVEQRLAQYGPSVKTRLRSAFSKANVNYPPHQIAYVAFKDQRKLQVYARNAGSAPWRFIKQYQVLAASGLPGPKLREGDRQVPEGMYKAAFLNANSLYHLSIRLNYPNDFDRRMAQRDQRSRLGGDIMIHGNAVSIGCLAMGDEAAEELFILAAQVNMERIRIVVSPTDFRVSNTAPSRQAPAWTVELYQALRKELQQYPGRA
jgi:murein L,D-transpeptidase YafK